MSDVIRISMNLCVCWLNAGSEFNFLIAEGSKAMVVQKEAQNKLRSGARRLLQRQRRAPQAEIT